MNVTCPNCATVYRVDPAKVPEAGVRARCAVCGAVFAVNREGQPARASTPVAAGASPAAPTEARPVHAPPVEPVRPPTPSSPPTLPSPPETQRPEAPKAAPVRPEPARPAAPVASPAAAPRPAGPAAPPGGAPPRPATQAPPAPSAPVSPAAPAAPARPVNPFLTQDPSLKARRLARALISDMVVYHPAKRQEGLRDGNLKELFEDEIKKSWEEYSDQVGRELAESTGYFREALNEILAGGRQLF